MTSAKFLSEVARLMNIYGPDSQEATSYIEKNAPDQRAKELAQFTLELKKTLCPNFIPQAQRTNQFVIVSPMGQAVSWSYVSVDALKCRYAGLPQYDEVCHFIEDSKPGDFIPLDTQILFRCSNES